MSVIICVCAYFASIIGSWSSTGPTNLWHACPKWHAGRFPWHAAFTALQFLLFLLPNWLLHIVKTMYVCIHISDCVENVYELPLLPNHTASETFLHKSEAVRIIDWVFITGALALRWLGEYVTLNKMFYNLIFKKKAVAAAQFSSKFSFVSHLSRKPVLEI